MENPTVSGLRSRSRSKTPFLRSSCDRENCTEGEEHTHVSGRKTPIKRSTPIKQIHHAHKIDSVTEESKEDSQPIYRTRQSARQLEKLIKTSDYSSEESPDRLKGSKKEIYQNEINSQYERVSTSTQRYTTLADVTLSPIPTTHNVTQDRSTRYSSPAVSACSTDSSFAEQALADASALLDRDPNAEHLPYKLYKMAGEYWNKYPKTDYTYSPLSRDRVELAPGQVAVPNMSRRSLSQFRIQGPNTVDEPDIPSVWKTSTMRRRFTSIDSSDDEAYVPKTEVDQSWLTRLWVSIIATITTTYRNVVGPSHRYPYTERRPPKASVISRVGSAAAAPFYWIYTIVTTTVTTVSETISPSKQEANEKYSSRYKETSKRRWWPWLALLLLPAVGYGLHYTYENYENLALPNFTDFRLDLSEFTAKVANISLPNITLPDIKINLTMPEMPSPVHLPEVTKTYRVYRDVMQNRMSDASEYMGTVAESCWEEMRRFWTGIIG